MRHSCAFVDCRNDATHIVVEGHALAMLFKTGAGLVCEKHALECARVGGVNLGPVSELTVRAATGGA